MNILARIRRNPRQAKLPLRLRAMQIKDLSIGEAGYTVPWALTVDHLGYLWIRPDYTLETGPSGTVQLLVSRHEDGLRVNALSMRYFGDVYKWSPENAGPKDIPVSLAY